MTPVLTPEMALFGFLELTPTDAGCSRTDEDCRRKNARKSKKKALPTIIGNAFDYYGGEGEI